MYPYTSQAQVFIKSWAQGKSLGSVDVASLFDHLEERFSYEEDLAACENISETPASLLHTLDNFLKFECKGQGTTH